MRIMLVDDDTLVLEALKTILQAGGHETVAALSDSRRAVGAYVDHRPDLVLMDIRMPEQNGLETAKRLLETDPESKILLLTTFEDREYIAEALAMGCKGYLLKQNFAAILPALQAVETGNLVFDEKIMSKLTTLPEKFQDRRLTEREEELTLLVAEGLNNKEIAEALHLSEGTVRNQISTILDKLDLRDRTQLAIFYYKRLLPQD